MKMNKIAASGLCMLLGTTCLHAADIRIDAGDQDRLGVTLRLPITVEDQQATFAQLQWQRNKRDDLTWSAGLMHRRKLSGDWIMGLGGFADHTEDEVNNGFTQVSVAAELMRNGFESRLNGYVPIGDRTKANANYNALVEADGTIRFRGGESHAMRGVDFEFGPRFDFAALGGGSLGLFAGGFLFDHDDSDSYHGATARAEVRFDDILLGFEGTTIRAGLYGENSDGETEGSAYLSLTIPLGGKKHKAQRDLLRDVIRREYVTLQRGAYGAQEGVQIGGRDISTFRRVEGGSAAAVQNAGAARAEDDLATVLSDAGENSVVFASGSFTEASGLTLAEGQMLIGGGGAVMVRSESGVDMPLYNSGTAAQLSASAGNDVVTLSDNSGVSGFALSGGERALVGQNVSDVWASGVSVSNTTSDGVYFNQVTNGRLTNVSVADVGGNGVSIANSTNVSIKGFSLARATDNGVLLRDSSDFSLTDASFTEMPICENNSLCEFSIFSPNNVPNSAVNAVGVTNARFADIEMTDVTYGFFLGSRIDTANFSNSIQDASSNITLEDVSITNSRREGILAVAVEGLQMENITIDNSAQAQDMDLIVIQSGGETRLNNGTLRGGINGLMFVNGLGLDANAIDPDMQFSTVTIDGTSRAGIFLNPVHNVSFENVAIRNAGTHGVHFQGDSFGFNGGPVTNIDFDGVSVDNAALSGAYFFGPTVDATGDITVTNTAGDCAALVGPFYGTELTNQPGESLTINGTTMTTAALSDCTGSPF
ncbi:inverse autotransporter beta domain-containing protein [Shimia marina]|uniref:Inverse autotransporter beta-domain domain-containing protein n=1 Tax=Shimia marina TaxID=321267 RepID=A0A0P1FDQ7_9RHOB|nr:inverse autotransporter beta domain-containing protein [Shimia marina]CUH53504.1 hypothetical protein SHM7688_02958 [Shimia marina]SFD75516.1 Invasin beta-domain of outer membrane [Shimia marina]